VFLEHATHRPHIAGVTAQPPVNGSPNKR
jgi:hypothetical protein